MENDFGLSDCLRFVFSFLDVEQLKGCMLVSKQYKQIALSDMLWKPLCDYYKDGFYDFVIEDSYYKKYQGCFELEDFNWEFIRTWGKELMIEDDLHLPGDRKHLCKFVIKDCGRYMINLKTIHVSRRTVESIKSISIIPNLKTVFFSNCTIHIANIFDDLLTFDGVIIVFENCTLV